MSKVYSVDDIVNSKLLTDLYFFTRYFFYQLNGKKWIKSKHFDLIGEKLNQVLDSNSGNLMINMPPRAGKTEMAVVNFIAMAFARNPKCQFIHLSASQQLVQRNCANIRKIMELPEYKRLFPNTVIANQAESVIKTTAGGVLYCTAFLSQITGFGAGVLDSDEFSGAIVIDDPMKSQDALSTTVKSKYNFAWENTIKSRKNDPNTPVIVVAQRLAKDDFCGHLLDTESNEWDVLELKALQQDNQGNDYSIFPERLPIDTLYQIKEQNEWVFETQYQQHPTALAGLLFDKNKFNRFTEDDMVDFDIIFTNVDVADSGNDYYAAVVLGVKNNRLYVLDTLYDNKNNLNVMIERQIDNIKKWKPSYLRIESNSFGRYYSENLRNRLYEEGIDDVEVLQYRSVANKEARIFANSSYVQRLCLFPVNMSKEMTEAYNELIDYTKTGSNKHDDFTDTLTSGVSYALKMGWVVA